MLLTCICVPAHGQQVPSREPGDRRLDLERQMQQRKQSPEFNLPPIEEPQKSDAIPTELNIKLEGFEFEGNTVFSDEELSGLLQAHLNRKITTVDLEEIRLAITNLYIENGYINSGALIPDQDLENNILKLTVVEGQLTNINLQNEGRLNPSYITGRVSPDPSAPLNLKNLQERLYILQQNPRIKRINASLGPGVQRGESTLDIAVEEEKPYSLFVELNNYRPPSIGEGQVVVGFTHLNLSGRGDALQLFYNGTEGSNAGTLVYEHPISKHDTSLNLDLYYSKSEVVEEPFDDLDLHSEAWSVDASIVHPFLKTSSEEYLVEFVLSREHTESFLGPDPTSCISRDGSCDVTALRLNQTALWHDRGEVISFRNAISVGVNAFNSTIFTEDENDVPEATRHDVVADSRFTSWLLQFQWAKRFTPYRIQGIFRADWQMAMDPLLPMEQFVVGGVYTVRGYRENQFVRDNGLVSSLEGRIPIFRSDSAKHEILAMAFSDYGRSWNHGEEDKAVDIYSVGLGLRWTYTEWAFAQVYWGYRLKDIPNPDNSLQDDGFHLALRVNAL